MGWMGRRDRVDHRPRAGHGTLTRSGPMPRTGRTGDGPAGLPPVHGRPVAVPGQVPGRGRIWSSTRVGWRVDRRCRVAGWRGSCRAHRIGRFGCVHGRTDRWTDGRSDRRIHPRQSPAPARRSAARTERRRVRRWPRAGWRASPGRAEGPQAEGGHPRVHVLRRRRRPLRARLARRQLVRDHERHVLDAQPQGIRRPAQARTRVPGPRPARDPVPVLGRGRGGRRAGRDRHRGRRSGPRAAARGHWLRRAGRAADPHHELLVGIHRGRDRSGTGARAASSHGPAAHRTSGPTHHPRRTSGARWPTSVAP